MNPDQTENLISELAREVMRLEELEEAVKQFLTEIENKCWRLTEKQWVLVDSIKSKIKR